MSRVCVWWSGAAMAALAGWAASGQDTAPQAGVPAEAQRDLVTVYATKSPLPVFDYPGQVTVITREEVELFAPSALSDLLRSAPGIEIGGGPRRTGETPSLRGTGRDTVLILLDGARQSFSSAHDGAVFVDPELIRSAEVVRGPASALYGSGAIGGVIALETVDAADFLDDEESFGARLRGGYQSVNEEWLASASVFGRSGALDGLASLGRRDSGDIALGSGLDLPSDDDIWTGLLKGSAALGPGFTASASWQGFRNEAVEPNNGQGSAIGGDVTKDIVSDTFRLSAKLSPPGRTLLDARATVWSGAHEVEEFDAAIPRRITRAIDSVGASLEERARFAWGPAESVLVVGGDWWRDEQVGRDDQTEDGGRDGVPDGESAFLGLYAQLETRWSRPFGAPGDLVVVPGLRLDSFESSAEGEFGRKEDEQVSPRFAASYGPSDSLRVFASWSEGFRAPSINELYLDGVHFSVPHPALGAQGGFVSNRFIANPNLRPETAQTLEAGVALDLRNLVTSGDRLQAKVSRWESEVEDLINLSVAFAFSPTCFAPPFQPCSAGTTESANVADAALAGWEGEAVYDARRLMLRAAFSDIDGEDVATGDKLGILTPARLNLDARLKLPAYDAALGARVELAEDFDKVNNASERRDGYATLDLYATWRPGFAPGVRLDVGVDNIFDEDYERVFAGVSEPGRNGRLAIGYVVTR